MAGQYRALRKDAGLISFVDRSKVRVVGADRVDFLHAMITNEVRGLDDFEGRHGALLSPTGRLVADFSYYRFPDHVLVDILTARVGAFVGTLEKYVVMDEVQFEDVSEQWRHFSVEGPQSVAVVNAIIGSVVPVISWRVAETCWQGASARVIRKSEGGADTVEILIAPDGAVRLRRSLLEGCGGLTAVEVGPEVYEIVRLERGIPRFGVDVDEHSYPMEARLARVVSFDKGCYLGQEVVSKATYVGGVSRALVGLLTECSRSVSPKTPVLSPEGKRIGHVTSSIFSPALERVIALAYVKKSYVQTNKEVVLETESGSLCRALIKEEGPLV